MIYHKRIIACMLSFLCASQALVAQQEEKCCTVSACQTSCTTEKSIKVDYIIVGGGTAGCVLARYLSENHNNKVLVLEAGKNHSTDTVILDGTNPTGVVNYAQYTMRLAYPDAATRTLLEFDTAKILGGCSAHNYMLTVHGSPDIYDAWATLSGNMRWTYNNLLPFMLYLEHFYPNAIVPDASQRGLNGPLSVTQRPPVDALPIAQAMSSVTGAPLVPDYNAGIGVGVSAFQNYSKIIGGLPVRSFAANAFLPPSVMTPEGYGVGGRQLRVMFDAVALDIIFKGNTARGVRYIHNGTEVRTVHARKKVIICAGAFSPVILQRSGVGPSQVLEPVGIFVKVDNKHVGRHQVNHYGFACALRGTFAGPNGPLGFIDLDPEGTTRRYQLLTLPFNALDPALTPAYNLNEGPVISILAWNLRPRSEGTIDIVDTNPFVIPQVKFNLYTDGDLSDPDSDASKAVKAVKIIKQIADTAGLELLYPAPAHFASDAELLRAIQDSPNITAHYAGACRMASSPLDGVVDGNLHVFGTRHLMVADNSICPLSETGNTAWSAYLIGLVAANILGFTI